MENITKIGISVISGDRPGLLRDLTGCVAKHGGNIVSLHHSHGVETSMYLEVEGADDPQALREECAAVPDVTEATLTESPGAIFGKRVIVIGGGAQVAQVVAGAVSEADRHNIRGERISVDTIPLIGEKLIADAVRAVGHLPRARIVVLAGSLMGGEITVAVRELREKYGIPVISLAMVGSVPDAADLVVTEPTQAGVMAVMAIADTATFDLNRVRGRRI